MSDLVSTSYIGIESFKQANLESIEKGISAQRMMAELRIIIDAGIPVHGHFIVGLGDDTPGEVYETVSQAQALGLHGISLFCETPFPGTVLRRDRMRQSRIIAREGTGDWSEYDLMHMKTAPLRGRPSEFQRAIIHGYRRFYTREKIGRDYRTSGFFTGLYSGMLHFALNREDKGMQAYIGFLEDWEEDRYDDKGGFIPAGRHGPRPVPPPPRSAAAPRNSDRG